MSDLFSEENVVRLAQVLALAIMFAVRWYFRDSAEKRDKAIDVAVKGAEVAFWAVEEAKRIAPDKVSDKVSLGLEKLKTYAQTHGVELKGEHLDAAKVVFDALNAQSKEKK